MEDINIPTIFTVLDLSNNLFKGEIPGVIGYLELLEVLNLSSNNLKSGILISISKLTFLESLDLSQNLSRHVIQRMTGLPPESVLKKRFE
ncbi:hypothetical protein NC653_004357 [Populus alba x Populus x berolinensis]|uniref:Uncharacterized protein n=1 Tax=Populus alba x Populus x berolinensis TaxID=444605 RepID=A0AAD6RUN2_9ROSI|nr:hypothetical protein NC653_004357 [Populus alba x Populus x berolinensis]